MPVCCQVAWDLGSSEIIFGFQDMPKAIYACTSFAASHQQFPEHILFKSHFYRHVPRNKTAARRPAPCNLGALVVFWFLEDVGIHAVFVDQSVVVDLSVVHGSNHLRILKFSLAQVRGRQ